MPDLDALRGTQSTPVLTPDDPDYPDVAQRWGPPSSPDAIVRPADAQEVGAAVRWAADEGVEVAVRSGGHGIWAPIPGGLLIDLGAFAGVEVADGGIARIGAGTTWGAVADALAPHGLAISSGDTRSVGVGGNALGAGLGWMVRSVGLAVDQLVGVQLVTADGRVVVASEGENPELFFALRGGGGNFGIATRLDFRAARLPTVVFGMAPIDASDFAATLRALRDAMRQAPRKLALSVVKPPPMGPPVPTMAQVLWAGEDEEEARAAIAPILAAPGVGDVELNVVPYREALMQPPEPPPGAPVPVVTGTNGVFARFPDENADRVAAALVAHPDTMFGIRFLGGAFGDVAPDATAIAWRDAELVVQWFLYLPPGSGEEDVAAARAIWDPVGEGAEAVLGTFTDDSGPDVVRRMYPPATMERLRAVKREWDPGNLFRRNHNIVPAESGVPVG